MKGTRNIAGWLTTAVALTGWIGAASCRATVAGDPDRPIKIEAHITLDVRQIKEEAHSIEDLVSGPAPKASSRPTSCLNDWLVPTAWAEMSPEAMQAVNARRDRFSQIKSYKSQGLIGEDNQGHVVVLGGGSEVPALVDAENKDRETIYTAQVAQKGLPAGAIGTIRAAFAEEQRNRAEPGEKIQTPSGEWANK